MCILVILQQKDITTKVQQSPRIPKDVSEPYIGPVEQTENYVSVEGPGAETGRQEVISGFFSIIYHTSCIYHNFYLSLNLFLNFFLAAAPSKLEPKDSALLSKMFLDH